jgi:xanthine dehydrogenase accessory factor
MNQDVYRALVQAARNSEPVTLGIISDAKGSSPQKVGAKALFYADGRIAGTLGGGCLEAEVQHRAVRALQSGQPSSFELLLDHDFGWDDGLICGGKVEGLILPQAQNAGEGFWAELADRKSTFGWGIRRGFAIARNPAPLTGEDSEPADAADWLYQETITPACVLWIAGAGHIAQAVAPLACQLDFAVTVFDDRPALLNHNFFPRAAALRADAWDKLLQAPLPEAPAFGLIVTRGHRHDALVLEQWIHQRFLFLGMIGSARKARTIFTHFRQEKLATAEELARVACPVGLRIRSQSVMEIAVSIVAQFIDKRAQLVFGSERRDVAAPA